MVQTRGSLRSRDGSCVFQLKPRVTSVGREGTDIILQLPNVEHQHATIEFDDKEGCFVLQDLNTAHGTYVNDCRIQNAAVRLAPGDVVRFGYGSDAYELVIDSNKLHYPPLPTPRTSWEGSTIRITSSAQATQLPYLPQVIPSEPASPMNTGSSVTALPGTGAGDVTPGVVRDSRGGSVLPHPPRRSRPASAGAPVSSRPPRPRSAGRERSPAGSWFGGSNSDLTAQELEQKLLKMGDEISRLAAFEAECHRKDGVISTLRDEISELHNNMMNGSDFNAQDDDLHGQIVELQRALRQKEDGERVLSQKLAQYQNQLHSKNEEVASLSDKLHTQQRTGGWVKQDASPATTNVIAELRTDIAEKDRRIAYLTNDLEKANKQKIQTTTLLNTVQRESAAKDALVQQAKREVEKIKKDMREKDVQVTNLSTRLTKHKVSKDAEKECERLEKELLTVKGKLQQTEKQVKQRNTLVAELNDQVEQLKVEVEKEKINTQSDTTLQRELDFARSQAFESQRQEKLFKVDLQQLQHKFDKFRRDVIQMTFSSGFKQPENKELSEDEIVNYIRLLSEDRDILTREIEDYKNSESETQSKDQDLEESKESLQKALEEAEEHFEESGRNCATLNEELTVLEELDIHERLEWIKTLLCNMLSNQAKWEQKIETALSKTGQDVESADAAALITSIHEELVEKTEKCDKLQERVTVREESHQEEIEKIRQEYEEEQQRRLDAALNEVRAEEEERRHTMMKELREKERDRIEAAVDMERKIFESQHGNLSQMQMLLSEKQTDIEGLKSDLSKLSDHCKQLQEALQRSKLTEEHLLKQLDAQKIALEDHTAKMELENEEIQRQKEEEVASFKEQTRQHAVTIVAMEDRLLLLSKQNKQLEQELLTTRQHPSGRKATSSRPTSSKKVETPKETPPTPVKEPTPKPETRSVTTETIPASDSALRNDIYKLEQLVLLLRREAAEAKKELEEKENVVLALRRDLAGASARLSDVAGELSDKQKEKLEEYREKIQQQDEELSEQRELLEQLSALVDQQKKQIGAKEEELEEQGKMVNVHRNKAVEKVKELTQVKKKLDNEKQEQLKELEKIEKENQTVGNLAKLGSKCRGERHEVVIARQKEALADLRQRAKTLEQFKPPLPSHEQTLQQVVLLKKELSELRAAVAAKEEDFNRNETELQTELRMHREQAASVSSESRFEKSAHKQTKDALDRSERSFIKTVRTLADMLEVNSVPGCRSMVDTPADERERVEKERDKALESLARKIRLLQQRLQRKENLLGSYEKDLTQLKEVENVAGHRTAQVASLSIDVRDRSDEVSYLRESVARLRDELDQQKRLNMSLKERKQFAMDVQQREAYNKHSCCKDEFARHKEEKRLRKSAEKMKRKNYEIESLKRELQTADRELNDTAAKLASFEASNSWRAHSPDKMVSADTGIIEDLEDDDATVDEEY